MKELSIEEKAKRYGKAIEKAEKWHNAPNVDKIPTFGNRIIEDIFPELKESEDEKMRKSIIYALRNGGFYNNDKTDEAIAWLEKQGQNNSQVTLPPFMFDDILALQCCMETVKKVQEDKDLYEKLKDLHGRVYDAYQLEKQGEQKSTDKVEPKFKDGQWIVFNGLTLYINEVVKGYYRTISKGGICNSYDWNIDNAARLWTIEDAKDGDVLWLGGVIAIFKKYIGQEECICYCSFCDNGGFEIPIENGEDNVYGCTNTTPATQEERDLLFAKIHEAGYEWDAENRELKSYKLWK